VTKLMHNDAGYGIQTVLAEVFAMGTKPGSNRATMRGMRTGASVRSTAVMTGFCQQVRSTMEPKGHFPGSSVQMQSARQERVRRRGHSVGVVGGREPLYAKERWNCVSFQVQRGKACAC